MATKCEIVRHEVVKNPKPEPRTHRGRLITPYKADRQKEVDFIFPTVHATFHDTGLLRILIYGVEGNSRAFQLTNTRAIYKSGHVEKFLEILQEVTETSTISFVNFRNFTAEFNDSVSGAMFRAVVDAPDIPAVSKFAAIFSTLISAPTLTAGDVLEIAKYQRSPLDDEGNFYVGSLKEYIFPHFSPQKSKEVGVYHALNLTNENIRKIYRLTGFLNSEDDSKTLFEFVNESEESSIKCAIGVSADVSRTAQFLYSDWGYKALQDLSLAFVKRIAEIPVYGATAELKQLLLNRIQTGAVMKIEEDRDSSTYLAPFLTSAEHDDFYENLEKSSFANLVPKEFGTLALEVIITYYLQGGFDKVKELLDLILSSSAIQGSNFFYTGATFELRSPVTQKMKAEHFKRLLDDEYSEMPLGWAIPLMVTAIAIEKQEKEEALLASGLIPLAA
jgi:hypothetical protein